MTRRAAFSLLVVSALLFGLMAFLSKLACRTYDGASVAGIRFTFGALATGALWASGRVNARPGNLPLLLVRGTTGGVAVVLYFLTIQHLSVGLATLLNYTSPPFTVFLARFFLGERLVKGGATALALTMLGVVLVVLGQPHAAGPGGAATHAADPLWVALGLLSAVCSAGAITSMFGMQLK